MKNPELPKYQVTYSFEPIILPYRGKTFEQRLPSIKLPLQEEDLKYAKSLDGRLIKVEGVMSSFRLSSPNPNNRQKIVIALGLEQARFQPELVPNREADK